MRDAQTYSNNLPEQAEHEMLFALGQIVGVDIDNVASDCARTVQC
jgi:hypothetical protein